MVRPNLGAFIRYLSAPAARRAVQAQRIAAEAASDYVVETDFWKRMRTAIVQDRRTTRDGTAVLEVADAATAKKQPSFIAVANSWADLSVRWSKSTFTKPQTAVVDVGGLHVAVRPLFAEMHLDGQVENVAVWMNKPIPSQAAIRGAMRLMTRIDPDAESVATFVDVRRGSVWSARSSELAVEDLWLEQAGARFIEDVS